MTATPAESRSPGATPGMLPSLLLEERRRRDRERQCLTRVRRRTRRAGGLVVEAHVGPMILHGLERLGLLDEGDRDPSTVAAALAYYLEGTLYETATLVRRFAGA
jgi:hypothetical protein